MLLYNNVNNYVQLVLYNYNVTTNVTYKATMTPRRSISNNTVKYCAYGMSTVWVKSDARQWTYVAFHKHNTLLYCCWSIFEVVSWGDIVTFFFLSIIRTWSALSTCHWLAQGWMHTTSIKLAASSALLGVVSDRPKIQWPTDFREDQSRDWQLLAVAFWKDVAASCSHCLLHVQVAIVCCSKHSLSSVSCADNSSRKYILCVFR